MNSGGPTVLEETRTAGDVLNITLLMGGPSAEREVSLKSGQGVSKALKNLGHRVHEIDPQKPAWEIPANTDVVCLIPMHGTFGEDGTLQRILERQGFVYTGCGIEASGIAFDKVLTKERLVKAGIPTAEYLVFDSPFTPFPLGWEFPVVIKPVCQGSSVGLQFVNGPGEWEPALKSALNFDRRVLLERRIIGRETTVGILEDQALPVVEVRPKSGAYDYSNKYTSGATEYFCPADFSPAVTQKIQAAALGAFKAVGCRDYARVDVMVTEAGEPVVLEVNTLPGMTETSLMPKAAAAAGINYETLCMKIIDLALSRSKR
jgi:D-alanine-D-alanine ligase